MKPSRHAHRLRALTVPLVLATAQVSACIPLRPASTKPSPAAPVAASVARAVNDSIRSVLDRAVEDGAFPGAFAIVGTREGVIGQYGAGQLDSADLTRPDDRTVWDMASLTKVIGTTSAIIQLVSEGRVALDSPVVRYLPEWKAEGADRVTVRQLLSHSGGLQAGRLFYKEASTSTEATEQLFHTAPDTLPGVRYKYSDIGFLLLGKLVEDVTGERLDSYDRKHVFGPAGMRDTRYLPPRKWLPRIAPTEQDPWRGRKVRGEVHDENAVRFGGVAGHAGLFSTGRDMARFARMYLSFGRLDGAQILDSATIVEFTAVQNPSLSHRALGWETPNGTNSAGSLLSAHAFGHTGFTGTSIWMDPDRNLFVILLTNRVNPTRQNQKIGSVRRELADHVAAAMDGARQ